LRIVGAAVERLFPLEHVQFALALRQIGLGLFQRGLNFRLLFGAFLLGRSRVGGLLFRRSSAVSGRLAPLGHWRGRRSGLAARERSGGQIVVGHRARGFRRVLLLLAGFARGIGDRGIVRRLRGEDCGPETQGKERRQNDQQTAQVRFHGMFLAVER